MPLETSHNLEANFRNLTQRSVRLKISVDPYNLPLNLVTFEYLTCRREPFGHSNHNEHIVIVNLLSTQNFVPPSNE